MHILASGVMAMKILITDKMANEAIQVLKDAGHEVTYDEMDGDSLLKEIPKYDALMIRSRTKAVTEVVEAGAKGNLKVIGRAGVGVDNIDIETAAKEGVTVVNSPTGSTQSVAELAVAHMLSLARFIPKSHIAQNVAKIASGFGMDVLVYSPHCTDDKAKKMGATRKDLEDLLKQSDFVSLHIPHTKESHYILNEKTLSLMKPTAYLINCARGGVVDENALYGALKESKIAGAAVDVFETEPTPKDNKLLTLDNVVFSPHIGASTKEAQIRAGTITAEQILKVLNGESPDFWVNKKFFT